MLPIIDAIVNFDRLQQDLARNVHASRVSSAVVPAMDLREDGQAFVVEIDLPGVRASDLTVSVDGDQVRVEALSKRAEAAEGTRTHRAERHVGQYRRAFRVPPTVDTGKVDAKLTDGVLTLTLGKREEVKPRSISIST